MRTCHALGLLVAAIALWVAPPPLQARWQSVQDNKTSIELAGMTNQQLFNEAFDVCVRRALLEDSAGPVQPDLADCRDYLNVLYPFVRHRNGGKAPLWMSELVTAKSTRECQRAFRTFLNASERPAGRKSAGAGTAAARQPAPPAKPKQPQRQPRSQWTEELPPWLAPR